MMRKFYLLICLLIVQLVAFGQTKTLDFANLVSNSNGTQLGTTSFTQTTAAQESWTFTMSANSPGFFSYNDQTLWLQSGDPTVTPDTPIGNAKTSIKRADGQNFNFNTINFQTFSQDQYIRIEGKKSGTVKYTQNVYLENANSPYSYNFTGWTDIDEVVLTITTNAQFPNITSESDFYVGVTSFTYDPAPNVTTSAATSVTATAAIFNGNLTSAGFAAITEKGFVYSTMLNPTTTDTKRIVSGTGTGTYTFNETALTAATTYHVRAYAINSIGTSYGADQTFTTPTTAATTLSKGDLAVIGMNGDVDAGTTIRSFAVVALNTIAKDEVIYITDRGWVNTYGSTAGHFVGVTTTNEGTLQWKPSVAISAGTVIIFKIDLANRQVLGTKGDGSSLPSADFSILSNSWTNTTLSANPWNPATGDQLIIYQGSESSPSFIFAFNNLRLNVPVGTSSNGWHINPTSAEPTNQLPAYSELPSDLGTTYSTAFFTSTANSRYPNVKYNLGSTSGTKVSILADITNTANWINTTTSGTAYDFSSGFGTSNIKQFTLGGSTVPAVTAAKISISGASGSGGAFKIGDVVTATWNNSASGDNNSGITAATIDFSQFGGGTTVTATDNSGTWTATYTITAGTIDATNRNISVTATNSVGPTTTADDTNATVDNIAPTVTDARISISGASGTGDVFKIGDVVTAIWNNTAGGDNNADVIQLVRVNFSQFGGGTGVAATNSSGVWMATYTIVAGSINRVANRNVTISATDNAGNSTTTADGSNATVDNQAPTATIVLADTALKIGETSLVTITFSEAVTSFTNADLTIVNGTLSTVSSSDGGITWTATFTPTTGITDATNIITLDNTGVSDSAGNVGSGTTDSNNYAVDTQRPTATIVLTDTALRIGETSLVTITFSEAVTGFTNADLTIANGTLSAVSSSDGGVTWTATLTPTANITDATNLITLANTGVADLAGNAGSGTTESNNYAIDTQRPTATIVVADNALSAGETSLVTFTFSEAVTGFTNADLSIANGTLSAVSSSDGGITWTATFTPSVGITDASNLITLANTGITDLAGNTGSGTTNSNNYTVNTTAPTATIIVADNALRIGETSLVTITFSEAVTGFTNADLTIANGTLSAVSSSDGGITWTATFTPTTSITDPTNVITLDNTGIANSAGNTGTGTTSSNNYAIDTIRPTATVVFSNNLLGIGSTSLVTVTFSEAVSGFTNADLSIANGTLTAVSSSDGGITWTATFTPNAGITDATNIITLDNTGVADLAGNAGSGTTESNNYAIDTQRPTATIVVADNALSAGETSLVTFTFSEAVTGFTNADLSIANGTLSAVSSSDGGITWTATFTPSLGITDASNLITLANTGITDLAGNTGTGTTNSNNYTIDTQRPTATIVVADTALRIGETSLVTITFSEAVTGFTNADLTIVNGILSAVSSSDGGITWTATFTPTMSINDATNVITLDNTGIVNSAGNAGTGTTSSNNYAIDTTRPTATIVVADNALRIGETSLVTITFSEAVTSFTNADLTIVNGTLSTVSSSDGGITWTATFTPTTGITDATNIITLDNTGVSDSAGNTGSGTTDSNNYTIDTQRPTATIVLADNALKIGETSLVTITFLEAVTGFTNADLTIANGTLSAVSSSDGGVTWTATLTPTTNITDATNLITLDNTGVSDSAGNAGTGTTNSNNYAVDTQRPTATIVVADNALRIGETSLVTITFSEAVTGFTNADLTIANGTLSAVSSSDGGVTWTATLTPTTNITDATNLITLDNTGVSDWAGNAGSGTTSSNNYAIDTTRPTATVVFSNNSLGIGSTSLVTVTFSEAVSGFTNADLSIANGTLTAVSSSDGGITWTATFTPNAGITDTTNIIILDNTGVADLAGNAGTGTTQSNNYVIDTQRPTATIVVADNALSAGEISLVTFTFSEAVTGFTNADLSIANGTLSAVSSSDGGITWTATFTPSLGITDASNLITLANTGITDLAGNTGTGTTNSNNYTIDTQRPTATIVVADTALRIGETSLVTITFSEAVTGFTNADLTIANGTLSAVSSSDGGITWTATFTPTTSITDPTNVITLDNTGIANSAGNIGTGTTSSNNYAIDTIRPTATVVFSNNSLGIGSTSLVTVTFSEAVSGFTNADLSIANGTLTAVSSSDGGIIWTATFTPTAGITDATNVITLNNAGVIDLAGNAGSGTTESNNYAIDTQRPTATVVVADNALSAGETSLVTFTFSEAVSGFTNADLTIANGTLSSVSSSDGGITWTATFTPTAGITDATNLIVINNTGIADLAGNTGTGTTNSNNYTIDTLIPIVASVSVPENGKYVGGENLEFTIIFNKDVKVITIEGIPQIQITIGEKIRQANYVSGSETNSLLFRYIIQSGDLDSDGITIGPLQANNGVLSDIAGNNAILTLNNVAPTTNVLIDATITPTITFENSSKTYGDANFDLVATSNSQGTISYAVISGGTGAVTLSGVNNKTVALETVGTVIIRATQIADGIYTSGSKDITLTITPKTVTVTAAAKSKTYGDADPALTYDFDPALISGDSFTGSIERTTGNTVGTYAINQGTLALSSNYTLTYIGADLTIGKKTITVTAAAKSKTYGEADPALTYDFDPALISGDSFTGSLERTTGNTVGTYAINQGTLALSSNYTLTYVDANLTIGKKTITVTATAKNKTYGDADPALTYDFDPVLVSGDNFTGSLERTTGNTVGTYAINQGTLALNSNYTLSYVANNFAITAKLITVTANASQSKVYGTADPVYTYSVSSALVSGDSFTGALGRVAGNDAGVYAITQGTLNAGTNYNLTYVGSNFTIVKANQTITWNQTLGFGCEGENTVILTATSNSGLPVNYTSSNSNLVSISGNSLNLLNYGSVTISASQLGNNNYNPAVTVTLPLVNSQPNLIRKQFEDIIFFDNSSKSFSTYTWYKNGVLVPGQTDQYFKENGPLNGTYYAVATKLDGIVVTTCPIVLSPTIEDEYIKIVPNPVKPNASYELQNNVPTARLQNARIEVYSVGGLLMENKTTSQNTVTLKAPTVEGIYIIKMTLANGKYFTKNLLVKN